MKSFPCPKCGASLPVSLVTAGLGSLGGKAGRGKAKARSSAAMSLAGKKGNAVRWGKKEVRS